MKILTAFILIYGLFLLGLSVLAQNQIDMNQRQLDNISNQLDSLGAALEKVK